MAAGGQQKPQRMESRTGVCEAFENVVAVSEAFLLTSGRANH